MRSLCSCGLGPLELGAEKSLASISGWISRWPLGRQAVLGVNLQVLSVYSTSPYRPLYGNSHLGQLLSELWHISLKLLATSLFLRPGCCLDDWGMYLVGQFFGGGMGLGAGLYGDVSSSSSGTLKCPCRCFGCTAQGRGSQPRQRPNHKNTFF